MEDRDFFDTLYQGWSKTTGAEDSFWMPEDFDGRFGIVAVAQDEEQTQVATDLSEEDAAFITAVHGCFGDLTRRLHMALDEADRLDHAADVREGEMLELVLQNQGLQQRIREMERELEEVGR